MDLVYMPEALPYGGILRPQVVYRDYEQPWNRDYYHLGKSSTTRYQQEQYQQQLRASREKDHCELCKNNKRRSLAAYIRNKSKSSSCNEIHEEEEENVDDNETNNVVNDTSDATVTKVSTNTATIEGNPSKTTMKTSKFSFRFRTAK